MGSVDGGPRLVGGAGGGVAAAVVADHGPGLVQAAPELAGQDGLYGMVGVESSGGQAVPDGVGGGPQQRSGDQPAASFSAVVRDFSGSGSCPASLSGSGSGTAARWTARNAVASKQEVTCRFPLLDLTHQFAVPNLLLTD